MTVKEMLEELAKRGFSQNAIAIRAGTTQPTIHRASKGADVRYETGKAIELIYLTETQKTAA
ncbi:hypothetical protein FOB45_14310 [Pseudomonas luteola]|nr:hypothetical protein FOB45_14310 [Pseudomonas luteola]